MKTANEITPLIATHPGETLNDELEAIGISQIDFAKTLGMTRSQLNEIIKGKRNINADLAILLEKALGIDAEYWMEAQKNFDLDTARIKAKNQNRLEAIEQWKIIQPHIGEKFFRAEKIISGDPVADLPIIYDIYGIDTIDQLAKLNVKPEFARFRKSEKLAADPINIIAWVKLVHYKALSQGVEPFDYNLRENLIADLRLILMENRNTLERVQTKLAQYGIKLIYQEKGDKTPVDGISFWSEGNPAIGMSLRHHRLDNFAFTLFHELGHVYKHLVNNNTSEFIDLISSKEQEDYKRTTEEIEANEFATNKLIDPKEWQMFFNKYQSFPDVSIIAFAKQINIHPCIVRGRICHEIDFYKAATNIDYTIL